MWFFYIIKILNKNFIYIGSTNNVIKRIEEHNSGLSKSTSPYKPFSLEAYIAVKTEKKAREPEKYLKTGSGKAVIEKRILTDEASA